MSKLSSSGVGIVTVIFLILLFLKLFGLTTISWWWIFSPIIIEVVIVILIILIIAFLGNK